jgi:hypothetical protein
MAALQEDGSGIAVASNGGACVGGATSAAFAAEFQGGLLWANAVEPGPAVGRQTANVLAIAVAADGTRVVDAAVVTGDGILRSATELDVVDQVLRTDAVGATDPAPPAREEFQTVYSRAAGGLYVLGGRSVVGELMHDVWFHPMTGGWKRLDFGSFVPGEVLAATFSFADQKLWILDRFEDQDGVSQTRLSRLDSLGGVASQVMVRQRSRVFDRRYLTVDRDRSVLLTAGNKHGYKTLRYMVDSPAQTRPKLLVKRHGALAIAPIVDDFYYTFVRWTPRGELRLNRRQSLGRGRGDDDAEEVREPTDEDTLDMF